MQVLRTPDERFENLPDYDFEPRYRDITAHDGTVLRYHFIDEGPADAAPILLLHGNPSWSYLHRHMIRGLVALGHRVVALDLMGLGRSDKPDDPKYFTLARHVDWMGQWLTGEDLALPHRVRIRRPHRLQTRGTPQVPATGARRAGAAPPGARCGEPLHPGGRAGRAGGDHQRVRPWVT